MELKSKVKEYKCKECPFADQCEWKAINFKSPIEDIELLLKAGLDLIDSKVCLPPIERVNFALIDLN